jgi:hypothetical protein
MFLFYITAHVSDPHATSALDQLTVAREGLGPAAVIRSRTWLKAALAESADISFYAHSTGGFASRVRCS